MTERDHIGDTLKDLDVWWADHQPIGTNYGWKGNALDNIVSEWLDDQPIDDIETLDLCPMDGCGSLSVTIQA